MPTMVFEASNDNVPTTSGGSALKLVMLSHLVMPVFYFPQFRAYDLEFMALITQIRSHDAHLALAIWQIDPNSRS
jgi:hypothetical protein